MANINYKLLFKSIYLFIQIALKKGQTRLNDF